MNADATIDPRERDYYSRLAAQWWDREGVFWPLHRLNELRVEYLRQRICSHFLRDPGDPLPLGGLDAVDIGCGGGILSESIARLGARVHGVDERVGVAAYARAVRFYARLLEACCVEGGAEEEPAP